MRCYEHHPPLILPRGTVVHGGNCRDPIPADVQVALSPGLSAFHAGARAVRFPIRNYSVPHDADTFVYMVRWLAACLDFGWSAHVGCTGGHGRTGMVLTGLAIVVGVPGDPLEYVRDNYCSGAVENDEQIDFLAWAFDHDL